MVRGIKRLGKLPSHLVYTDPNPKASEFEINNWQLSEIILNEIVLVVGVHPFPLNEQLLMAGAVARFKPRMIFEWGTHIGKSARIFYEVSEALGLSTIIHSIDLPDQVEHSEHPRQERGKLVRNLKRVELHQGDGVETSLKILNKNRSTKNGKGALFLVDGDHLFSSVKRELAMIMKCAPEAAILLHDTFYQDARSKYNVGPARAIDECMKGSRKKYKRIDTATGLPGMTLLYPIK